MIFNFKKFKKTQYKKGMTYVELVVVLSIFSIMSAVTLVDYGKFQAKVDIKNLANDIALQIVGAQKNAMAGKLTTAPFAGTGKPAYGVYFDKSTVEKSKQFIPFADIGGDKFYSSGEELDTIQITKGSYISYLETDCSGETSDLSIVFIRPDSSAIIMNSATDCNATEAIIGVNSQNDEATAKIYVYSSGRIEIK